MDFGRCNLPIWAHFEEEWKNFFPLDIPPYSHNPQYNAEAGSLVRYGEPTLVSTNMQLQTYHNLQTWSLPIREINDGLGMPHPENLIFENPPDSICQTTFAPPTTLGRPVVSDGDNLKFHLDRAGVNTIPDQSQGGASMIVPTKETYQGTPVSATSNFLVPSLLSEVADSDASAVVKDPKQKQSRGKPQNLQKARKGSAVVSSVSSRQATGIRRAPKRYSCNICGKRYAQSQGVRRHQRETHRANLCMYCYSFKWGRPYRYKAHLEKEHPDVAAMRH